MQTQFTKSDNLKLKRFSQVLQRCRRLHYNEQLTRCFNLPPNDLSMYVCKRSSGARVCMYVGRYVCMYVGT
jgi:hypothetical protein